ncbi:sulfotransferase domain-containing protein [Candidatus Pseudothioglobus singularis]|jgi:hypothetical protein|nr:sulfotransferase domain-containing protein [Candidatus Pseudothioglobus singularis]MDB4847792.1 sulfotransferase domain-containing protein [Candidatus Pseudothioglobus singularis]
MKLGKTYDTNINLSRENTFDNEVIIIDGQGRSGKNLISVLLTCMPRVEKMRLDSQIDYIPRYYFLGKMSLDAAVTSLRTEFDEKYYYNSISRDVNFRIDDYSGVLKQAKRFEYFKRLFLPADDAAVARIKNQKPIFQEMTHDGLHVATLFFKALKNRLKMIHVFRDPVGNIYEQNVRNFGTRIGTDPREFQLTYLCNNHPVTLNAIGKEEEYLSGNPIERLVLTVDSMFRLNVQGYFDLKEKEQQKIYFIEFEDFVENPLPYIKGLENFIGESFGRAKKRILKRERCPRKLDYSERERRIEKIRSSLRDNYDEIFMKLIQDYDSKPWLDWK